MISVSTTAIASLIRTGMLDSPNPGNSITMAPMRANTSMKVAASAGSSEISIRISHAQCGGFANRIGISANPPCKWQIPSHRKYHLASTAYDSRRQPHHVGVQRVRHERQRKQERDEDRQNFRNEHQRLLLNLGECLEQRHDDADHETHHHQRRGHHDDGPDRITRHIEGFSTGHWKSFSPRGEERTLRVSNHLATASHPSSCGLVPTFRSSYPF